MPRPTAAEWVSDMSTPIKGKPKQPERKPTDTRGAAAVATGEPAPADSPSDAGSAGAGRDNRPRVTTAARSDKGRVRPDNQDNYVIMPLEVRTPADSNQPANLIVSPDTRYVIANRGLLMGVFDGMGGVAGGQWAACEAARSVGLALFEKRRDVKADGKPGEDPEKLLDGVLHETNGRIHQHGYQKPEWMGMGSTATTAWVVGRRMIVGQVGDSRAYLLCNGEITQLTCDQTLVNALVKAKVLTEEQAAVHPRRTELLECLGPSPEVRPELYEVTLPAKSRLLLCSDGLHGPLNSIDRIKEILAQPKLPSEICRMLVDAANGRGGHDNITAIVADIEVPDGPPNPVVRQLTPGDALLGYLDGGPASEPEDVGEPADLDPVDADADYAPPPPPQTSPMMWGVLITLILLIVLMSALLVKALIDKNALSRQGAPEAESRLPLPPCGPAPGLTRAAPACSGLTRIDPVPNRSLRTLPLCPPSFGGKLVPRALCPPSRAGRSHGSGGPSAGAATNRGASSMNRRELLIGAGSAAAGLTLGGFPLGWAAAPSAAKKRVLFFTRSAGFQHDSVNRAKGGTQGRKGEAGKVAHAEAVLTEMAAAHNIEVVATKDGSLFTPENIAKFDAFAFYTTGDLTGKGGADGGIPMTPEGKAAFLKAIEDGKGFIGFHSATDTFHTPGADRFENVGPEKADPYINMIGAEFIRHGPQQSAKMRLIDNKFPGFEKLADFDLKEEWYSLKEFAKNLHVLLVQETKGMTGTDYDRPPYPATWARMHGKGRVFYTSMGHREDVWTNPIFQSVAGGGLSWILGLAEADVTPNLESCAPQCATLPPKPPAKNK
jgi:serine/threonine protein phosphatase PrpC/type 1 glutamine amidotransferase